MEGLHILILADHHAIIDVTEPKRMSDCKEKSDDGHHDIGSSLVGNENKCSHYDQRRKHSHQFDDELDAVFKITLARQFLIKGQGLLVVDSQLEQHKIEHTATH